MAQEFLNLTRQKAAEKLPFLPHAIRQMIRPDRMISTSEVRRAILDGEIIEDYPDDVRGHSCLILGRGDADRAIHIVCSPKNEYLVVITAYIPSEEQWLDDSRTRRTK